MIQNHVFDEGTKKGFSAKETQLGFKRYEPVWQWFTKGNRDSIYALEGMIEFDEAYFTVESREIE